MALMDMYQTREAHNQLGRLLHNNDLLHLKCREILTTDLEMVHETTCTPHDPNNNLLHQGHGIWKTLITPDRRHDTGNLLRGF